VAGVRVVLDTQVWLDWLVFDDPGVASLRAAHAAGRIEIVIDDACEAELERALGYELGRIVLSQGERARCVTRCRSVAQRVIGGAAGGLPRCRDADDQKFLELAAGAGARYLVSRDRALLELAPRVSGFRIVAPADLGGI